MSYLGGYTSVLTLAFDLPSSGCLMGVDVNPPWGSEAKCTCHRCWCAFHVASLASSSSNWDLPVTEISWEIPEACAVAAPLLAFMVPGCILNASLCNSFNLFTGGTGTSGTLLCCSWTLSRIVCCFSNRVDNHLISLDWDLISLACWRCKCDRTDTCVWWAISSSIISARRASWPWRAWASAERCCKEALLWDRSSCKAWALSNIVSHALFHIAQCKGTRWGKTGLSLLRTHSGLMEVNTIPWYYSNSIFLLNEIDELCHRRWLI